MTLLAKRLSGALALASILGLASPSLAATYFYQISDVSLTGFFGTESGGGTFDSGGNSSVSIQEHQPPSTTYTYTLSGPADGAGWNNIPSQQPPTLCIIAGCNNGIVPGSPFPFSFGLNLGLLPGKVGQSISVGAFSEDDLEDYSGTATITLLRIGGVPEPTAWAMMLLGLGLIGAGLRLRWREAATRPAAG